MYTFPNQSLAGRGKVSDWPGLSRGAGAGSNSHVVLLPEDQRIVLDAPDAQDGFFALRPSFKSRGDVQPLPQAVPLFYRVHR